MTHFSIQNFQNVPINILQISECGPSCTFGDNLDEKNPGLDTGYVKNDGEKLKLRSCPF